jgi:XTP/dITP diphosphohydrolase
MVRSSIKLLVATRNKGKIEEIRALLKGVKLDLVSLRNFPEIGTVEESGSSYEENALLKCITYARDSGIWALADDSGLEVDALDGAPGVLSARYGGVDANDADRVDLLLCRLSEIGDDRRTARFRCTAAIADPEGKVLKIAEGICEGRIARAPRGSSGFGYDPVFIPAGYDRTFAEVSQEEKDRISHRGIAMRQIREFLQDKSLKFF